MRLPTAGGTAMQIPVLDFTRVPGLIVEDWTA
jgi:hypothetical protein